MRTTRAGRGTRGRPQAVARVVLALAVLVGTVVAAGPASPAASALGRVCPPSSPNCSPE
jgi:hypothetical protein